MLTQFQQHIKNLSIIAGTGLDACLAMAVHINKYRVDTTAVAEARAWQTGAPTMYTYKISSRILSTF